MNSLELLPSWFIISYMLFIGLCIGSFLNVAILRGLSGEDIVFARSKCPKCGNQLKWYMNIPVISYIFLGGKCGFCKEKISIQYPLVELICALLFLGAYFEFDLGLKLFFIWAFLAIFIVMSATDFKETVIIDYHAYVLCCLGLLYSYLRLGDINLIQSIIGAVFGFLIFEIMARTGKLFAGCRMFGEGDSLIALGLGAIFGWKVLLLIIFLSILIQAIVAVPILIFKAIKKKNINLAFSYFIVLIAICLVGANNYFAFAQDGLKYYILLAIVLISLFWSLKNILFEIKNRKLDETKSDEEKFNLMPFGPALLFCATLCIFYLEQIKGCILNFVG